MAGNKKILLTNIAVGVLGLIIGIDNLLRWNGDQSTNRSLIIGSICGICALGWLIYTFLSNKKSD